MSDKQWSAAFRAGGFEPEIANRFIKKLQEKVEQGRPAASSAVQR